MTKAQEDYIAKNYQAETIAKLAKNTGLSETSVRNRVKVLKNKAAEVAVADQEKALDIAKTKDLVSGKPPPDRTQEPAKPIEIPSDGRAAFMTEQASNELNK